VLVVVQAILGGLTVIHDLSPALVMAHLTTASALLLTLLFVTIESLDLPAPEGGDLRKFHLLAGYAALATFALMLTGSYVSGSDAGLAITDWPLFNGSLLPDGGRLVMIHALHRIVAAAIGLVLLLVAIETWRSFRWYRPAVFGIGLALGIYAAQALVGAANVWSELAPAATASHLALAILLFAVLSSLAMLTRTAMRSTAQPAPQPRPTSERTAAGSLPAGRVT
jgi:cytochrome c oxidase assembly protein subunit 15